MSNLHALCAVALVSFTFVTACGSEVKPVANPTSQITIAIAATDPSAASSAVAVEPPTSCSSGAACKRGEICCRVQTDGPVDEFCAAAIPGGDNPLAACAAALPASFKQAKLTVSYTALPCTDSNDCKDDEICVLAAPYSSDSLASSCVAKKPADGFVELCGRGTCKLGKSACETANPDADWSHPRSCVPTSAVQCGKFTCDRPQVCCVSEKGPACVSEKECKSFFPGARWECTSSKECTEGQTCCVTGGGHMGAQCAFACESASQAPTCSKDSDCPEVFGAKTKCKPAEKTPSKSVKSCQI